MTTAIGEPERGSAPPPLPRLPAQVLQRPHLTARLNRLSSLTVVQALPGYGKTTLAASWALSRWRQGDAVAWVSVTEAMDAASLVAAIVNALGVSPAAHRSLAPPAPDVSELIARTNENPAPRVIVVLDDLDHCTERGIPELLTRLLVACPKLHLVGIGRPGHALAHTRWADTTIVGGGDLLLSVPEISAIAAVWGHDIAAEQVRELHELTGGWVELVRLLLDSARVESQDFDLLPAQAYVRNRVFPDTLHPWVLQQSHVLALLDSFSHAEAETAVSLSGGSGGQDVTQELAPIAAETIQILAAAGLITLAGSAGAPRRWRFNVVPACALRVAFDEVHPQRARRARSVLARQLFDSGERGRTVEVLRLAREGCDWELLSRVWCRHTVRLTVDHPAETTAAFRGLPAEALRGFPVLSSAATTAEGLSGRNKAGGIMRLAALDGERLDRDDLTKLPSADDVIGSSASAMIILRMQGRHARAREMIKLAQAELVRRANLGLMPPSPLPNAWFLLQSSLTLLLAGHEAHATELSKQALRASHFDEADFVHVNAAAQLMLIHTRRGEAADEIRIWREHHESGEIAPYWFAPLVRLPADIAGVWSATDRLDEKSSLEALAKLPTGTNTVIEMWPYVLEAEVRHKLTFGSAHDAWNLLNGARSRIDPDAGGDAVALRILDHYPIDALLAMGELDQAQHLIDGHTRKGQGPGPRWLHVPAARLQLMAGNNARARAVADAAIWRPDASARDRIELGLISAAAAMRMGAVMDAERAFAAVAALAYRGNLIQPFAGIPAEDLAALQSLQSLPGIPSVGRQIYPARGNLVQLTSKEREVLALLVAHDNAASIARRLSVSPNTVKKQIGSIYAKFGVHGRQAALEAAVRLGMLGSARDRTGEPGRAGGAIAIDSAELRVSRAGTVEKRREVT